MSHRYLYSWAHGAHYSTHRLTHVLVIHRRDGARIELFCRNFVTAARELARIVAQALHEYDQFGTWPNRSVHIWELEES